jgi:hypothetical protein
MQIGSNIRVAMANKGMADDCYKPSENIFNPNENDCGAKNKGKRVD